MIHHGLRGHNFKLLIGVLIPMTTPLVDKYRKRGLLTFANEEVPPAGKTQKKKTKRRSRSRSRSRARRRRGSRKRRRSRSSRHSSKSGSEYNPSEEEEEPEEKDAATPPRRKTRKKKKPVEKKKGDTTTFENMVFLNQINELKYRAPDSTRTPLLFFILSFV